MGIKRVLAATMVIVFMSGMAFAQTAALRSAEQRQRQAEREAEQRQQQAEERQRQGEQRPQQEKQEKDAAATKVLLRQAAEDFVVMGPGVVRDKGTGLEWMRCSLGQEWSEKAATCEGDVERYAFEEAQRLARVLNADGGYNGETDWRVPTRDELLTLRMCSHGVKSGSCADGSLKPSIAQTVFPKTSPGFYWTSSPSTVDTSSAWGVYFSYGYVDDYYRDYHYPVRLVRTGQ